MNPPVVLSPAADRELGTAADWYQEKSGQGVRFVTQVQCALENIGRLPELHAVIYKNVRRARVPKYPYNVYYRVLVERIEILAIVHVKRNPSVWQSRA